VFSFENVAFKNKQYRNSNAGQSDCLAETCALYLHFLWQEAIQPYDCCRSDDILRCDRLLTDLTCTSFKSKNQKKGPRKRSVRNNKMMK